MVLTTGPYLEVETADGVIAARPDATMATNGRNRRLEPYYKQHAVVDDVRRVVLDVAVTTGETRSSSSVSMRPP